MLTASIGARVGMTCRGEALALACPTNTLTSRAVEEQHRGFVWIVQFRWVRGGLVRCVILAKPVNASIQVLRKAVEAAPVFQGAEASTISSLRQAPTTM